MDCKDCIHYEACYFDDPERERDRNVRCDNCANFKDKSRFIELPCKAGETVYFISYEGDIQEGILWCFEIDDDDKKWMHILYQDEKAYQYIFDMFGKCVFLTKEEAEKALKEMEK